VLPLQRIASISTTHIGFLAALQEQLSNEGNNLEMDISDFSAGLYLVQVTRLDGSVSTANFIRQ
jgi:hypothetical protein